ncbi:sigma-70 family RNA polymerase sigma factor [Flavobacterium agricola]|uniref:Sigma-70 family RNA polymerase sigma factor n=1 Tax=Flavobacterium agricola TaxID=2870839 RepID=A0ABY6LY36_9FLAO|nr:sigma-70 family RNA polymerase sigma factor [Flavobacterium agricola]UYW01096.1 sigma-70 family RNA polymerase sigma factor [Flavobacterium agricola]
MVYKDIIYKCLKNDVIAQEQLYKMLAPKMFSICLKYSRNYTEAQDNLQDGFILLFTKLNTFAFKGSFEGWAKRLFINNILQTYRSPGVLEIVSDELPEMVEVEVLDQENIPLDYLLKIVQDLPNQYRLVFNLYVFEDYSHKEIAELLNISTGTSKSNLARARLILKEKVESYQNNNLLLTVNE